MTALPTTARAADGSISIGLAPADDGSGDPRSERYVVDVVRPGTTFTRDVWVSNATGEDLDIDLDAGGALIEDDQLQLADDEPSELVDWIALDPATLPVPAGSSKVAAATFTIPDDAADGERYAVIWAQPRSDGDAERGTIVVNRVGVRVYLMVSSDGEAHSDVVLTGVTPARTEAGAAQVGLALTNSGERALEVAGTVTLDDDVHADDPVGTIVGGVTIAPGHTAEARAVFAADVARGPWRARIVVSANGIERRATAHGLTFPHEAGTTGEPVDATMERPAGGDEVPALLVAAAVAAIVAMLIGGAHVRSRLR